MICNSLILPHFNYSLLAWGCKCQNIETLQKMAISTVHSKSPIANTEPIFNTMNKLKLSDMYTCHLLELYYKLYRNRLPTYFENFIPEYGKSSHNLRNVIFIYLMLDVSLVQVKCKISNASPS